VKDVTSGKPLRVASHAVAGPYFWVPYRQLDQLRSLFESHHVRYYVGENAISINGGPEYIQIWFGKDGDAARVQALLDAVD
jgi:hypothetical protein